MDYRTVKDRTTSRAFLDRVGRVCTEDAAPLPHVVVGVVLSGPRAGDPPMCLAHAGPDPSAETFSLFECVELIAAVRLEVERLQLLVLSYQGSMTAQQLEAAIGHAMARQKSGAE